MVSQSEIGDAWLQDYTVRCPLPALAD